MNNYAFRQSAYLILLKKRNECKAHLNVNTSSEVSSCDLCNINPPIKYTGGCLLALSVPMSSRITFIFLISIEKISILSAYSYNIISALYGRHSV